MGDFFDYFHSCLFTFLPFPQQLSLVLSSAYHPLLRGIWMDLSLVMLFHHLHSSAAPVTPFIPSVWFVLFPHWSWTKNIFFGMCQRIWTCSNLVRSINKKVQKKLKCFKEHLFFLMENEIFLFCDEKSLKENL